MTKQIAELAQLFAYANKAIYLVVMHHFGHFAVQLYWRFAALLYVGHHHRFAHVALVNFLIVER